MSRDSTLVVYFTLSTLIHIYNGKSKYIKYNILTDNHH